MALKKALKKDKKVPVPVSFRFTAEAKRKLADLSTGLNLGQTEILEALIELEYSSQAKKGLFKN